jgi:hypothetical protein
MLVDMTDLLAALCTRAVVCTFCIRQLGLAHRLSRKAAGALGGGAFLSQPSACRKPLEPFDNVHRCCYHSEDF